MLDLNLAQGVFVMSLLNVLYSQLLCLYVGHLQKKQATVMTGGSLGMAFHASSSRHQSSFSVVSCWSVVSKKTGSSCARPVDSRFTSIGFLGMSYLIFKTIFSLGSIPKRDEKSAAVLILPGMCAMVKFNWRTKSQAFHKCGGIIFVWKNLVTDLLSVMIITGLVAPQNIFPNCLKAM